MAENDDVARYRTDLQGEIDSASLYRALAETEEDPCMSTVYQKLAAMEDERAEFWRKNLNRVGARVSHISPSWRTRALA